MADKKGKAEKKGKAKPRPMKAKKRTTDKWKRKKMFTVYGPPSFDRQEICSTVGEKPENLKGRKVSASARELLRQAKKHHITFNFKVNEVQGLKAYTVLKGFEIKPAYMRRLIRRRSSKIECNQTVFTKEKNQVKVKTIVVTHRKAPKKKATAIRKKVMEKISETAAKKGFEDLVQELVFGSAVSKIFNDIKKISPIKRIEVVEATMKEGK